MPFMYMQLHMGADGLHAKVVNHGSLHFSSLGGPNSRMTDMPFAVFRIEAFDGLEFVDDTCLLDELFRRYTTKELFQRLHIVLTDQDLLDLLKRRLNAC